MRQKYIKPVCQAISIDEEELMDGVRVSNNKWTPTVQPGGTIKEAGQFEFIHEGKAGDEAESKFHHNWNLWDDEE